MRENEVRDELLKMQAQLRRYADFLTSNRENAKDLLQKTNLRTLEHPEMFKAGTNFQAWTFTIMYRLFLNDLKKWSRMVFTPDMEIVRENFIDAATYDPVENFEIRETIEEKLKSLSEIDRRIWRLYEKGYAYEEIAESTGVLLGTVKSKIHTIKRKLKNGFSNY